eukprot:gnl/MRDRNA2_/MRDRNA2_80621_c0_seq3.p2 gnl/MRDRNA2_/MRDRNA2_80621_c0~~gnl/MRDRNA2_/MRDRNA2_80621_c0_seq3.p2  ORF type:complete len:118 (+),score=19.56 gnl/MRDRNA2_/MRDRNA2_80621_c0_seq3:235-588(+)
MALVDVAEGIHWVDFVNSVVLLSGTGMMHTRSGDALPCMHSCTAPANELNADLSSLVVEFRMRCLGPIISKLRQAAEHVTGSIGMQRLRDASGICFKLWECMCLLRARGIDNMPFCL